MPAPPLRTRKKHYLLETQLSVAQGRRIGRPQLRGEYGFWKGSDRRDERCQLQSEVAWRSPTLGRISYPLSVK